MPQDMSRIFQITSLSPSKRSYIEYWISQTGIKTNGCAIKDCGYRFKRKGLHGGHIRVKESSVIYIVPLCPDHNPKNNQDCNPIKKYYKGHLVRCPDSQA